MREHYKSTKKRIHTSFMENASATTPDPMTLFVMFTMDPPTVALASDSCLLLSGMKSSSISSLPSGVPTCISTFHVQQSACYVSGDTGGSGFRTNRDKEKTGLPTDESLLPKHFHSQRSLLHNVVENLNLVLQDRFLEDGARELRPLLLLRHLLLHLFLLSMTLRIALMKLQVSLRYKVQLALWTYECLSSNYAQVLHTLLDMLFLNTRQLLALFSQCLLSERGTGITKIRHCTTRFGMSFTFSRLSR